MTASKVITYVDDGKEKESANHKGTVVDADTPVIIGDNDLGGADNFRFFGVIDEVAIYNRTLNPDEISKKMKSSHALAVAAPKSKLSTTW